MHTKEDEEETASTNIRPERLDMRSPLKNKYSPLIYSMEKTNFVDSICCSIPLDRCDCGEEISTKGRINRMKDFNIIKCLGRGGFGNVYLATKINDSNQTLIALKVVDKNSIKRNSKDIQHAITESKIMRTLSHPFIVTVHDTFETPRRLCYVMEFLQGGELYTWLERKVAFDESTAKYYLAQVYLALTYLHDRGILYRDLKPENVMFDSKGNAKLIDFGLSQNLMNIRKTRTMCGTTLYMSPEVITKEWYSFPADWWSFGILAYDMLVGNPPFIGENRHQSRKCILQDPVRFPKKPMLSRSARQMIVELLAKDPKRRIPGWEIPSQPFFRLVNFDTIYNQTLKPPIVPDIKSKHDLSHFTQESVNPEKGSDGDPDADHEENEGQKCQNENEEDFKNFDEFHETEASDASVKETRL